MMIKLILIFWRKKA